MLSCFCFHSCSVVPPRAFHRFDKSISPNSNYGSLRHSLQPAGSWLNTTKKHLLSPPPPLALRRGYGFETHRAEKTFKRINKANECKKGPVNVTERSTAQLAATGFR